MWSRWATISAALQSLPYWWQAQYQRFRRYYRPRSDRWPALPSYDAVLRELFRPS